MNVSKGVSFENEHMETKHAPGHASRGAGSVRARPAILLLLPPIPTGGPHPTRGPQPVLPLALVRAEQVQGVVGEGQGLAQHGLLDLVEVEHGLQQPLELRAPQLGRPRVVLQRSRVRLEGAVHQLPVLSYNMVRVSDHRVYIPINQLLYT